MLEIPTPEELLEEPELQEEEDEYNGEKIQEVKYFLTFTSKRKYVILQLPYNFLSHVLE